MKLFELMTYFDWLVLPRTFLQSLAHADWRGAGRRGGAAGLLGANAFPFFVPLDSPWGPADIQGLLSRKGIKLWGLGFANGEMFFQVSRKQAAWAQYVMQRAGVPLLHGTLAESPGGHAAGNQGGGEDRHGLDGLLNTIDRFLS